MTAPLVVTRDADPARRAAPAGRGRRRDARGRAATGAAALRGWAARAAGAGRRRPGRRGGRGSARRAATGVHVVVAGRRCPTTLFRTALARRRRERRRAAALGGLAGRAAHRPRATRGAARGLVVGVVGGSGGAGATTLACALGQVAAPAGTGRRRSTPTRSGPALDRVLGLETQRRGPVGRAVPDHRPAQRPVAARGAAAARRARRADLVRRRGRQRCRRSRVREALSAAQRGHDLVVLDLPRSPRRRWSTRWSARCDLLLVVVVPTVAGVASAARLVRPVRRPSPAAAGGARRGARAATRSPGSPACRVVAAMPDQRGLAEAIDLGLGPVRSPARARSARAAAAVLAGSTATRGRGMSVAVGGRRWSRRSATGWPRDARRADAAPGGRGAARGRAPGRRRHGARGPRGAAPRRASAPGRSSRCCGLPGVTDVLVNGADQVYLDRGAGLELDRGRASPTTRRCAGWRSGWPRRGGRRLDDATPYVDVRLADGTRFHAVLAPVARPGHGDLAAGARGARASPSTSWSAAGSVTAEGAGCCARSSRARLAFLVSGGTGSGKTTLLAALLVAGRPRRAAGAGRGLRRAAPRPPARGRARGAAAQHRGRRRDRRCARWCGRRCGCGPTGWSSARCAAPRWSTCWPR